MTFPNYKENEEYGESIFNGIKMSARERNVKERLALLKKSGIIPMAEMLEIGSHEGLFLREAQKAGFEILGIEPNLYAANYAIKNGLPTIVGSFKEAFEKIKDKKFDIVALFHTLEHMPGYLENLKKIKTIINPGGYLIIEVPNSESYRSKKYGNDWMYVYEEHLHNFSPDFLKKILLNLNFKVKKNYFRDFDIKYLSVKALLDRLLPFKFHMVNINRSKIKQKVSCSSGDVLKTKITMHFLLSPVKFFLIFCVKILHRGDFIMVVAKWAD